jgi:hypothetical protein
MGFSDATEKAMLDWVLGGGNPSAPAGRFLSLATASPNGSSSFDAGFTKRATVTFAAANSPQGSATNLNAIGAVTATAAVTANAWNLWDASAGGNRLAFGTLTANLGFKSGDDLSIAAGNLKIVLS